jgi:hypothetical protein
MGGKGGGGGGNQYQQTFSGPEYEKTSPDVTARDKAMAAAEAAANEAWARGERPPPVVTPKAKDPVPKEPRPLPDSGVPIPTPPGMASLQGVQQYAATPGLGDQLIKGLTAGPTTPYQGQV